jgi:pyruvate/2-oxoglutarate dehydrogenase complex dihydrolipoamide dehydrogenase (E3) component
MGAAFDAIVIGAGQAGPSLAGRLTAAGRKVALVERHLFGGTCVNVGCMPTKALVASAQAAYLTRRAADFGVTIGGPITIDMPAVKARKDVVAHTARGNVEKWLDGMTGLTVLRGHARFTKPHELRVGDETITAPEIFINVGGRAAVPDFPGIGEVPYLTNSSILELTQVPRHLVVVGGSYIGLEFAQMYRRFGAEVTVIERGAKLLSREDADVSDGVRSILEKEGVAIRTGADCIRIARRGDDIGVSVDCTDGEPEIVGSHLLLATGRRPNTDDLGLAAAGIATNERGYITVDDQLRTSVPGVWAMGDCNGRGAFTHTAYNDFEIVAANLLDGEARRVSDRIACYGLFIDPPLGRVGLTEAQAKAAGHKIRVGKRMMTRVGRAVEKGETQGFMKVVVDAETDQILGGAILGVGGDEAVHAMLDTMAAKAPYRTLQHTVHIHPTVAELIPTILGELKEA